MRATRSFQNPFGTRLVGLAFASFQAFLAISSGAASAQAPDTGGDTIAFSRDGAIWLMNADGTGQRALQYGEQPAWSPDGTRLASRCAVDDPSGNLCLIDVRNGYTTALTASGGGGMRPTFSPNGKKIAYADGFDIWVMDAEDGANRTQLTFLQDTESWATAPSFSPDGSRLAFATEWGDVYVMSADGSSGPQLVAHSGASNPDPTWSPDRTKLSYIAAWNDIMYLPVHRDGTFGAPSRLAGSGEFVEDHAWSPDGNELAYSADGQIIVENLTALESHAIASGYTVAWEPAAAPAGPDGTTPAGANVTVDLGVVTVNFSNVTSPGTTTAVPVVLPLPGHLPGIFILDGGWPMVSLQIRTTADYEGPVTVTFRVPGDPTASDFANIRITHRENGSTFDRTVRAPEQPAPDFAALQISARVSSL